MVTSNRYYVSTRTASATPSGRGKYRRPIHVRVLDSLASEWHAVRGIGDGMKFERRNVDGRYTGPRSECGRSMAADRELAEQLNRDETIAAMASASL